MASFNKNAVAAYLMLSQGAGECEAVMAPLRSANGRHRGQADADLRAFCSGCLLISLLAGAILLCDSGKARAAAPHEGQASPKPQQVLKIGEPVHTVAFSPDGKLLFAVGDRNIHVWDLATRKQVRKITVDAGIDYHTAAFSQDRKRVAVITSAAEDNFCIVYETATGKRSRKIPCPPPGIVNSSITRVAITADGTRVAASRELEVHIWEVNSGKKLHTVPAPPGIEALTFSPDGRLLATGSQDGTARLWDVQRGKEVRILLHRDKNERVRRLAFSPDGRLLATATYRDPGLCLWDVATGKKVRQLGPYFQEEWERLSDEERVKRHRMERSHPDLAKAEEQRCKRLTAEAVAFSPDGKWLASAGLDQHLRLWEVATGKEGASWPTPDSLPLAFSPEGRTLTSGATAQTAEESWSSAVALWDRRLLCQGVRGARALLSSKELETCWNDLSGDDAARACQAVWLLASVPERAVERAGQYLDAVPAATTARIRQAVVDLGAKRFQVREQARRDLDALGERARPALVAALRGQPSTEARKRMEALLEKIDDSLSPERLRNGRLVEVLEHIGNRPAQQILKKIASGCLGESAAKDAGSALQRLSNSHSPE